MIDGHKPSASATTAWVTGAGRQFKRAEAGPGANEGAAQWLDMRSASVNLLAGALPTSRSGARRKNELDHANVRVYKAVVAPTRASQPDSLSCLWPRLDY